MNTDLEETDVAVGLDDAEAQLGTLRGQIDALDTAIQSLVSERIQISRRIQRTRMSAVGSQCVAVAGVYDPFPAELHARPAGDRKSVV